MSLLGVVAWDELSVVLTLASSQRPEIRMEKTLPSLAFFSLPVRRNKISVMRLKFRDQGISLRGNISECQLLS